MGGAKDDLARQKQEFSDNLASATNFINGWVKSTKKYRAIALIILLAVIGWILFSSIFLPSKFFPKEPSSSQIQKARIIKDIKDFQHLHFPTPK